METQTLRILLIVVTYQLKKIEATVSEGRPKEGGVRLMGWSSSNSGRVEVYHSGAWGTVCDDGWSLTNANVVCKQLGYPDGASTWEESAYFGKGEGPILLDDVTCTGRERYLADCENDGWYYNNCDHNEDVGVRCIPPESYYPRLVNGSRWYEGRVEVWIFDHWEGVCSYNFYHNEARTVCKQLGYKDVEHIFDPGLFGDNFDLVTSVYFDCDTHDKSLSNCDQHQRPNIECEATAVRCLQTDESLSRGAIFGISLAILTFFILCVVTCVTLDRNSDQRNRTSSPNVVFINGTESSSRQQSDSSRLSSGRYRQLSNIDNGPVPPSYYDAVFGPLYNQNLDPIDPSTQHSA